MLFKNTDTKVGLKVKNVITDEKTHKMLNPGLNQKEKSSLESNDT